MLTASLNGALTADISLYERLHYDLSNTTVLAQADGSFSISRFALAGAYAVFVPDSFYAALNIGGTAADFSARKSVTMLGRTQAMQVSFGCLAVECAIFLDANTRAVFQHFRLANHGADAREIGMDFGFLLGADADDATLVLACDAALALREVEGKGRHYTWTAAVPANAVADVRLAFALQTEDDKPTAAALLQGFNKALSDAKQYADGLTASANAALQNNERFRECGDTALLRALYASTLNCGLSAFKRTAGFQGFYAGIHYASPARTYFRDGYFTALPLLAHAPARIREEIKMLALGIADDASCPSAVLGADAVFWPNHLDSPCFFVMMAHDYLAATRDFSLLDEIVKGNTILAYILQITNALLAKTDENGLLYREAGNRHDWADNVFREGYVTFVEVLFYRALDCAARVCRAVDDSALAVTYEAAAKRARAAINRILWDEEKGWYVNYRSEACTEDNLSIDTVLCVVFGIADEARARRLLGNMEAMLESRNNAAQPFGDWGTLCCWPPYKHTAHLVEKSAYPFVYHNGSDWPYWSAMYAFAKGMYGLSIDYPLTRWFTYSLEQSWATPVEYFNPVTGRGSFLQAWSAMAVFAADSAGWGAFPYEL